MPLTGAAAARLYDDHVDAVHAMIARRIGSAAAPGVTGETFEQALRTWDRFDGQRGTERLFLLGAATTTLRHHLDAERAHLLTLRLSAAATAGNVGDPLVTGPQQAAARVVDHEANRDLRSGPASATPPVDENDPGVRAMQAVVDLTPEDRDVVLLSLWESCPQSAIAEALDMSVGSVRSALGRIRRELKIATTKDPS